MKKKQELNFNSEQIVLFSEEDINVHGKLAHDYPAWYFQRLEEDLIESISSKERELSSGAIDESRREYLTRELAKDKTILASVKESKPKIKGASIDKLKKHYEELSEKIKDALFTRDEMMKGLVDPHKEANRISTPCIPLRGELFDFAKANFLRSDKDGKFTRDDVVRLWKIAGKALTLCTEDDHPTNVEELRR